MPGSFFLFTHFFPLAPSVNEAQDCFFGSFVFLFALSLLHRHWIRCFVFMVKLFLSPVFEKCDSLLSSILSHLATSAGGFCSFSMFLNRCPETKLRFTFHLSSLSVTPFSRLFVSSLRVFLFSFSFSVV